mgnify:CR=1 FL=1
MKTKTAKSLYIAFYNYFYNDNNDYNFFLFVFSANATEAQRQKHFCNVVYKSETGKKYEDGITGTIVSINKICEETDYSTGATYKIALI